MWITPCGTPSMARPAIAEIGGEEDVVLGERGAEQRRLMAGHRQPEQRQHAGVVDEQPVADAADVAMRIGDDEAVLVLQGELAMRLARAGVVERCQRHGGIELSFVDGLRLCRHCCPGCHWIWTPRKRSGPARVSINSLSLPVSVR